MYFIIGGDGREYGPASVEQIKAWIAGGRADENTQAKLAGSNEWKRLADLPEFQDGAVPPPLSSSATAGDTEAASAQAVARAGKLDVASCYERSWNLLRANFWPLAGTTVAVTLAFACLWLVTQPLGFVAGFFVRSTLGAVLSGGYSFYLLKKIRGQPSSLADAYSGFSRAFAPLAIGGLLVNVLACAGFFLLVLPGIYLVVAYSFTYVLIIDRKLGFWAAMEVSRRVVTPQWWSVLLLLIIALAFALLGLALLLIGIFAALPLIQGAMIYAYEDLFGPSAASSPASSNAL